MARLFIKGKDYGPHAFVVPIRDMATHLPLPGIKVGDIGPKFGYNGVDNGFLSFNHVRVPLDNMLMRFSKVRQLSVACAQTCDFLQILSIVAEVRYSSQWDVIEMDLIVALFAFWCR